LLITISSFDTIGKELSCLAELDVISLFIVDEVNMIPEDGKSFRSGPGTLNPKRDSNLGVVMLGGQKGYSNLSNLEVTTVTASHLRLKKWTLIKYICESGFTQTARSFRDRYVPCSHSICRGC
jgi:hypothetical protein